MEELHLHRLRRYKPFGRPEAPLDPQTGKRMPTADPVFAEYTVVEEGIDALRCTDLDEVEVLVAKPATFRGSEFDGLVLDGVTYASTTNAGERSWELDGTTYTEKLTPAYAVGEKILACRVEFKVEVEVSDDLGGIANGPHDLFWVDLNQAGRNWPASGVEYRAQIASVDDNSITAYIYNADETLQADAVVVAKPKGLRKDDYSGDTYDGASYVYVSSTSRTADGTTQTIIPSYRVGEDLFIERPVGGTGVEGAVYQDTNNEWRAWSEVPA
jgi:hypothetical protein